MASTPKAASSSLVPLGGALIVLAVVAPRAVHGAAQSLEAGALKGGLFILSDLLRVGFFVGLAMVIIGALRNRKNQSPNER